MSVIEKDALDQVKADTERIIEDVAAVKVSADKAANNDPFAFIDEEVLAIGQEFSQDTHIWFTVNLPKCESIGYQAFMDRVSINQLNLPKVKTIGNSAFRNCVGLTRISLPELEELDIYSFSGCTNLAHVEISEKVKVIPSYCFANSGITELDLPYVTDIENNAFQSCIKITALNLPLVISIGNSSFNYCHGIKNIVLESVETIGDSAFYNSNGVEKVDLHSAVNLMPSCFHACSKLKSLIIRTNKVCTLGSTNCISGITPTPNIYVPDDLVSQYKKATNWSSYASYIKPLSTYVEG